MFNKKIFGALICNALLWYGCNSSSTVNTEKDTTVFYPIQQYFNNELKGIDSSYAITVVHTSEQGKKDTANISITSLQLMAQPFLQANINDVTVKKYYTESSFYDETTNSYTFSYTTSNKELPVQRVDVLLDTLSQQVKRVFIATYTTSDSETIIRQSGWKTGNSFFINAVKQPKAGQEQTEQLAVEWKPNN